jgi:hypothetical protein
MTKWVLLTFLLWNSDVTAYHWPANKHKLG